ncbi:MAG TPA: RagB/SusD family nutrient uptake outer membrane protein [Gemmatimonadaceae bacterium]|nr:RagB/SusD family nutrient uptake outer membrane protein [Gemmatimonadaceae bacterium]
MTIGLKHPLLRGTAAIILATVVAYGCKDFLSAASEPQGTLNQTTLANRAGVEGSLIAAYRALDCTNATSGNWGCAASNWVFGSVVADDSYKGSDITDQSDINDLESYHWGSPTAANYLNVKWQQVYEGVVRANSTLRLLKQVKSASPTEFSAADANGVEGEAIFLRAHYHFEAYRMWGNIPYYREDETDFKKPNEDTTAVIADLEKDLDSAIKLLPPTPRNGQKGRASLWAAKAYLGRVQAYAHQYTQAKATFEDVVANGPYKLETSFDKVWSAFQSNTNGPETIWAYQASVNDGEPGAANANYGERLNFPYAPSQFQCCGFNPPTQALVNFYQVDAAGLPLAMSSPTAWNTNNNDFVAGTLTPVDPRLDWTVARKYVPYKDWGLYDTTFVRDPGNGGPYSPKKTIYENAAGAEATVGWQPQQQSSMNIHLFRYADLLLLLAEADVETNNLAQAMALVNQVRARAAVTVQGCGQGWDTKTQAALIAMYPQCTNDKRMAVPMGDPSVTWAVYRISPYTSFPTQQYARDAVQTERRLELAMEGQRLFDLRRYGTFATVLNGFINGGAAGGGGPGEKSRRSFLLAATSLDAKHRWYPIPFQQIDLSKTAGATTLTQNPGW